MSKKESLQIVKPSIKSSQGGRRHLAPGNIYILVVVLEGDFFSLNVSALHATLNLLRPEADSMINGTSSNTRLQKYLIPAC